MNRGHLLHGPWSSCSTSTWRQLTFPTILVMPFVVFMHCIQYSLYTLPANAMEYFLFGARLLLTANVLFWLQLLSKHMAQMNGNDLNGFRKGIPVDTFHAVVNEQIHQSQGCRSGEGTNGVRFNQTPSILILQVSDNATPYWTWNNATHCYAFSWRGPRSWYCPDFGCHILPLARSWIKRGRQDLAMWGFLAMAK